jgi:hypothetical protein
MHKSRKCLLKKKIVGNATYNEGVVERCKDVSNSKDILSFTDSGSKSDILLLGLSGLPPRLPK